jgi:hypothetical protein
MRWPGAWWSSFGFGSGSTVAALRCITVPSLPKRQQVVCGRMRETVQLERRCGRGMWITISSGMLLHNHEVADHLIPGRVLIQHLYRDLPNTVQARARTNNPAIQDRT